MKFDLQTSGESTTVENKMVGRLIIGLLVLVSALIGATAGLLLVYSTDLPQVDQLEHYRPSSITELYDDQGRIVGSFALQRRVVASYDDYPEVLRQALISIEDKDFYRHWGINVWRIAGAAYRDIRSGGRVQGASTLTMQLARNLFLSPDRSFHRKIQEALLAVQIERRFTKPQIFTLYANQIYLGHGVYGFEAASEFYFSKPAKRLTLDEAALLAGLPKSPSYYSPITHPERAIKRRNLVINSMLEDGVITTQQATAARDQPLGLELAHDPDSLAPYFVEEIRRYLEAKYGSDQVHEGGLRVYTSLDTDLQRAANRALFDGLAAYERRHGWRGHLENILTGDIPLASYQHPDWDSEPEVNSYVHALVMAVSPASATLRFGRYIATLLPADAAWTRRKLAEILKRGDIVYVKVVSLNAGDKARVTLEEDSGAQGALVAIDNATGEIKAMVGGRDFNLSKFNRATQALRQVGSSFKPYVYTAAIDRGDAPDDTILDAPVSFPMPSGPPYEPHNYDEKFEGTITLRRALAQSRNIPALKLADSLGIKTVIDYAHRFGITSNIPPYLPVALGAVEITPIEQTSAFSVFPNDGVHIAPRYITKVTDYEGRTLEENFPDVKDVVGARTARIMTSMLREVVQHGTAIAAASLKYPLAGKTGTTNNFTDAWFVGFSPSLTCGVWIGYDEKKFLGARETGAHAALPVWIDFMKTALAGKDPGEFQPPPAPTLNTPPQKLDTPDTAPPEEETH
ncbi:MAG TPA: PBP1A family penicillin-binding protein [Terriglobales bacterium]|nr:PBP1A family penicillin-binding protein [Terriglobales bacterium]